MIPLSRVLMIANGPAPQRLPETSLFTVIYCWRLVHDSPFMVPRESQFANKGYAVTLYLPVMVGEDNALSALAWNEGGSRRCDKDPSADISSLCQGFFCFANCDSLGIINGLEQKNP
jgi:hypothetical protein